MIKVTVLKNMQDCQQLQSVWQELTELPGEGIFRLGVCMSFEWTMALWESHLGGQSQYVMVAEEANEVLAILPCYSYRAGGIPGLKLLTLSAFSDLHFTRAGILCRQDRPDAIAALLTYHGSELAGCARLVIPVVEGSPSQQLLDNVLQTTNLNYFTEFLPPSPYIELIKTEEEFFAGLDKEFRRDLCRRERNLKKLGQISLVVYDKTDDIPCFLKIMKQIEQASWKEKEGTSITTNLLQHKFYKELLPRIATKKWLFSAVLWIDEKPIAYGLRLLLNNVLECLKISYVQEYKRYSPGNLLHSMIIHLLYDKNISYCDLQGNVEQYKTRWSNKTYRHIRYIIYRKNVTGWLGWLGCKLRDRIRKS